MSIYNFGFPDVLVRINFPDTNTGRPPGGPQGSYPWFWYIGPPAKPFFFQFEGSKWGNGWQRTQAFPQIRILPIDTQGEPTPTTPIGYTSIEDAIDSGGGPDAAFGRFKFTDPFFWQVMGQKKPQFTVDQGRPTDPVIKPQGQKKPIATIIKQTVKLWSSNWNFGANVFNQNAASGVLRRPIAAYDFPKTRYALPLPTDPSILGLLATAGTTYLGPIPGGFWFNEGNVEIYKQAYSFSINVQQLSVTDWNMSHFPPTRNTRGFETFDCSGYGETNFPLSGPQILGG